jgi:hydrogenase maturation protease
LSVRRAPLLVFAVGNPSRGDDALGSLFAERAAEALGAEVRAGHLEVLTDFQLQIEHALDLEGRRGVVFVDASVRAQGPYEYARVEARRDESVSTHALSPAALLDTCRRVFGDPPPAWTLAIRGERFELGEGLSPGAEASLDAALGFFVETARAFSRGPVDRH